MKLENIVYAGLFSTAALVGLSGLTSGAGLKVAAISWTAFLAMILGGALSQKRFESTTAVIWTYGLSGGAALASISMFVLPKAYQLSPKYGGLGMVLGFLSGLSLHSLSHGLGHDSHGVNSLLSVTMHAAAAGLIIGIIYQQMPAIGILLGLAIVSHKLPAGYMISSRLEGRPVTPLLLPASILGTIALTAFNLELALHSAVEAVFFGFSAGIFIHVALDFIPNPEPESHLRKLLSDEEDPLHHELDDIRVHCILSTVIGGLAVALAGVLF